MGAARPSPWPLSSRFLWARASERGEERARGAGDVLDGQREGRLVGLGRFAEAEICARLERGGLDFRLGDGGSKLNSVRMFCTWCARGHWRYPHLGACRLCKMARWLRARVRRFSTPGDIAASCRSQRKQVTTSARSEAFNSVSRVRSVRSATSFTATRGSVVFPGHGGQWISIIAAARQEGLASAAPR